MIFVDTSFWVGIRLRNDDRHAEAVALLRHCSDEPLVTSHHVRGETWTFLRRKAGHDHGVAFLDMIDRTARVGLVRVEERLEAEALRWLRRHDEREYSFVDATSFALMRSLRIKRALAFGGDFAAAGFTELRA